MGLTQSQNTPYEMRIAYELCRRQKFESQLQIAMSNLMTNPKFKCVTKLIKYHIKEQIKWCHVLLNR
jgi:hypothetical protein